MKQKDNASDSSSSHKVSPVPEKKKTKAASPKPTQNKVGNAVKKSESKVEKKVEKKAEKKAESKVEKKIEKKIEKEDKKPAPVARNPFAKAKPGPPPAKTGADIFESIKKLKEAEEPKKRKAEINNTSPPAPKKTKTAKSVKLGGKKK